LISEGFDNEDEEEDEEEDEDVVPGFAEFILVGIDEDDDDDDNDGDDDFDDVRHEMNMAVELIG
jgi:hypothetical protein